MYVPSKIQNYEDLKMELPSERLELDWVYPSRMPEQSSALFTSIKVMLHSDGTDFTGWSFSWIQATLSVLESISLIV